MGHATGIRNEPNAHDDTGALLPQKASPADAVLEAAFSAMGPTWPQDHLALRCRLPVGALHFASTDSVPERTWPQGAVEFETNACTVAVRIELASVSDLSSLEWAETTWDTDAMRCRREFNGCRLSLLDLRQFVGAALMRFRPFIVDFESQ